MRVLLVDMPFDQLDRPALGLSLLKARLAGVADCDVLYANILFAKALSAATYTTVSDGSPALSLAGEWVFRDCLFGHDEARDQHYVRHVLAGMPQDYLAALRHARSSARAFVNGLVSEVPWDDYDVVGFTSSGAQNLAAMALARRLKERIPGLVIIAGGPNWHGPMGLAQLRAFPFVDIGFLAEGEEALAQTVRALAAGEPLTGIDGIALSGGRTSGDRRAAFAPDLDALPCPDVDDYFRQLEAAGLHGVTPRVSFEASRGCRWAERTPCTFCGLSGPVRRYRSKSRGRILSELRGLAGRVPGGTIDVVDNMVPRTLLAEVLPDLVRDPLGARLSFEARPDLSEADLEAIAATGASLQVGIESLSDQVLRRMAKGTTVLRVVRLLRLCKEHGVTPAWNIIVGIPGETDDDYREMIELIPSLRHLEAPLVCTPFNLVRFSPLFDALNARPSARVRPSLAFRLAYDLPADLLHDLASVFDYDDPLPFLRRAHRYRLRTDVQSWQTARQTSDCSVRRPGDGALVLVDSRSPEPVTRPLDELEAFLLLECARPRTVDQLARAAAEASGEVPSSGSGMEDCLDGLVSERLLLRLGGRYLSLPSLRDARPVAPEEPAAARA